MTWAVLAAGGVMGLGLFLILLAVRPGPPEAGRLAGAPPARRRLGGGARPARTRPPRGHRRAWLVLAGKPGEELRPGDRRQEPGDPPWPQGAAHVHRPVRTSPPVDVRLAARRHLPPIILWAASAIFGAVMFTAPELSLRVEAANERRRFRRALVCYLDLVALCRLAGRGPADALDSAARVGKGQTFKRLSSALDPAFRGTGSAWDELARLSRELDVPELGEVAAIAKMAGTEGASILDTLKAKAASLRESEMATLLARAKSRTETMTVPMSLTVVGFMILLGYPALARMTGGG